MAENDVIDTTVTQGHENWTDRLDKAVSATEKQKVVREYLKKTLGEQIAQKVEPLVGSITQAADEVGLSEEDLPLITFLKLYYSENNPQLSRDEYLKLHNSYSTNIVDENNLADASKKHIIFNPSLYKNSERDFKNIVEVYNILSSREETRRYLKLAADQRLKVGGKEVTGKDILDNPTILRDELLFDSTGNVNSWPDIQPIWNKLARAKDITDYEENLKLLYQKLSKENNTLYTAKGLKYKLLAAISSLYSELSDDIKEKIKELIERVSGKPLDEYIKENNNDVDYLKDFLNKSQDLVNDDNIAYIVKLLIEGRKSTDNKQETTARAKRTTHPKSEEKYNELKQYIDSLIRLTKKDNDNLYRYIMYALANYKPANGNSIADQANAEDKEFYDIYVKNNLPQELKDFSQKRFDDVMSRPVFTKGLNKGIAKRLIKYLDQYKPAQR